MLNKVNLKNKKLLVGLCMFLTIISIVVGYYFFRDSSQSVDTRSDASYSGLEHLCTDANSKIGYEVSKDGINFSEVNTLNVNFPERIYVKFYSSFGILTSSIKVGCSMNFGITLTNQAGEEVFFDKYASILSNSDGIARLDWDYLSRNRPGFLQNGYRYTLKFSKPLAEGTSREQISYMGRPLNLIGDGSAGVSNIPIDFSSYIMNTPGNTYFYKSRNQLVNDPSMREGNTKIQIEQPTEQCGILMNPWRFTKDNIYSYWQPYSDRFDKNLEREYYVPRGNIDLRWMVVNNDFSILENTSTEFGLNNPSIYNKPLNYDDYFWVRQDKRYRNNSVSESNVIPNGLYEFNPKGGTGGGMLYNTSTGLAPAYNLGPKISTVPFTLGSTDSVYTYFDPAVEPKLPLKEEVIQIEVQDEIIAVPNEVELLNFPEGDVSSESEQNFIQGDAGNANLQTTKCPPLKAPDGVNPEFGWRLRIERDTYTTFDGVTYDDVLRYDFFEGKTALEDSDHYFRETWYFAKNVGVIGILTKYFNNYVGIPEALPCAKDPDCTGDKILNPHNETSLTYAYTGQQLNVRVGQNPNPTYNSSVEFTEFKKSTALTNPNAYYLSLFDNNGTLVNYSGYLEVQVAAQVNANFSPRQPPYESINFNAVPPDFYRSFINSTLNNSSIFQFRDVFKWNVRVVNGVATVKSSDIVNLPDGNYVGKFRVEVPNEDFVGEKRRLDRKVDLPFSNPILVIVSP